jgi:hypothetical protein
LRDEVFYALGNAVVAFKDKDAYSIGCGGYNTVSGIIFWMTRVRTHLAPGLDRIPEELAFDPWSADLIYDVRQVRVEPSSPESCKPTISSYLICGRGVDRDKEWCSA